MPYKLQTLIATGCTRLRRVARTFKQRRALAQWENRGRLHPPPFRYKAEVLRGYAVRYGLRTMVETGTFQGDMACALKDTFASIVTIELAPHLYAAAKHRFAHIPQITCLLGDSGTTLSPVLARLDEPALFWLDAHYSGGETAKGSVETPVTSELESILAHHVRDHVVLIDDARCFDGTHDYPVVSELRDVVGRLRPDMTFELEYDVIRITPRGISSRSEIRTPAAR